MINVAILGASGSIGKQAINVIKEHADKFNLVSFSVGDNIEYAKALLEDFKNIEVISFREEQSDFEFKNKFFGEEGLIKCATHESVDIVLVAVVGFIGVVPTMHAIKEKKDIALANKETLVCAGDIIMDLVKQNNVTLYPVDSEHSAIYQCLDGQQKNDLNKIILTSSGGSFRNLTRSELKYVTVEQALDHPNWNMGSNITIDSATMFNKGLEVIEAHHLFGIDYDDIEVIIHYESIIHSMIELNDTSVLAQLGTPDMRLPILYALSKKMRLSSSSFERLNLGKIKTLNFKEVDYKRYPALKMSYDAGKIGGSMPTVLNASKEVAVRLFLEGKISFLEIERVVYNALSNHELVEKPTIEMLVKIDEKVRKDVIKEWST